MFVFFPLKVPRFSESKIADCYDIAESYILCASLNFHNWVHSPKLQERSIIFIITALHNERHLLSRLMRTNCFNTYIWINSMLSAKAVSSATLQNIPYIFLAKNVRSHLGIVKIKKNHDSPCLTSTLHGNILTLYLSKSIFTIDMYLYLF